MGDLTAAYWCGRVGECVRCDLPLTAPPWMPDGVLWCQECSTAYWCMCDTCATFEALANLF